jgi:hypothetical protein
MVEPEPIPQLATIHFTDAETGKPAHIFVRAGDGCVGLEMTVLDGGDLAVVLGLDALADLLDALHEAGAVARGVAE